VVDLVALAQLGGFATLGIVMTLAANKVFMAWRDGDLISRPIWERSEARADLLAGQLERNTEALRAHTAEQARLVRAIDRLAAAQEKRAAAEAAQARKDAV
jgi:hypothetical protein